MKRREFFKASSIGLAGLGLSVLHSERLLCEEQALPATDSQRTDVLRNNENRRGRMLAGFAKVRITPPNGTRMCGWDARDNEMPSQGVRDDLFARALWMNHNDEEALIMAFDLCFFSRAVADRLKGALGRELDLMPDKIMLNTSHTHNGPSTARWASARFIPQDRLYLDEVCEATVRAAVQAKAAACEVTLSAGTTRCSIAINRRKPDASGVVQFAPNKDGKVYDSVPICLFEDQTGQPVCLLFSASCHPSVVCDDKISADYVGVATKLLDQNLGRECAMFLQGVAGDTKVKSYAKDEAFGRTRDDVEQAGRELSAAVIATLKQGLKPTKPGLCAHALIVPWPLETIPTRAEFEAMLASLGTNSVKRAWAELMIAKLVRGQQLPTSVPVTTHGIQLGEDVRIVALEGEAVAELGTLMSRFYENGVTFPLGYIDGCQLYLPTTPMLAEHGYEVDSYYEYGWAAPLAPGMEDRILDGLRRLRAMGIG